jgi:uncharacterized membrane protein
MSHKSQTRETQASELRNILAICEMERRALQSRTLGERIGDFVASISGRIAFVVFHVVWFGLWIGVNSGVFSSFKPFDPYPFSFLTFVVSLEAIFLSLFILMSQNRFDRQAENRTQLDLQINLLAELEATKALQMLRALCEHNGLKIASDPEVRRLAERTEPERLVKELQKNLPNAG